MAATSNDGSDGKVLELRHHLPLPPRVRLVSTDRMDSIDEEFDASSRMFQQINIDGPETMGISKKAFSVIANKLFLSMEMRRRYMEMSNQTLHPTVDRHLRLAKGPSYKYV